jgi:hypothetical protein
VEVTTRLAFHEFEAKLRERRFIEDQDSGVICRWRHDASQLILDAMPARGEILGFENRWHAEALPRAVERELPSGATIRAVSPPYLLATKLEAFRGRGSWRLPRQPRLRRHRRAPRRSGRARGGGCSSA